MLKDLHLQNVSIAEIFIANASSRVRERTCKLMKVIKYLRLSQNLMDFYISLKSKEK